MGNHKPFLVSVYNFCEEAKAAFDKEGMNVRSGNFNYKSHTLQYYRLGDSSKTALLFVHGSPGCWDFAWDYFMDKSWQADYELISIDRPGFGGSDYGDAKNLFEQSEIINAFVKEKLPNRKVRLIGHSYGGPLVLQLCADNDTLYDKCIIMAGSISPKAEKEEWQLNLFSNSMLKWAVPGAFEQGVEELLWLKDDLNSNKYLNGLQKIKTSIVAIYGTKDNMVPYQPNIDFLLDQFDSFQIQIHTLEGANHFLPWKNYEEVKKIIIKFK